MGAQQSKVKVAAPTKAQCFPWFSDEADLLAVVKKIHECHSQAIQASSWVGAALLPTWCVPGGLVFSAATVLFTFILYQLSGTASEPTCSTKDNPSCSIKTLEDALIDAKVSAAIARKSVCELQAKICVIQNRYERLLSKISVEDRRLEVVPAIQTCEEVLQLFHDSTHVFRLHPLISSPFLITFSGIFVSVAELSMILIPSYKAPLLREMLLLGETLSLYKHACIQARMDSIKFKNLKPDSMIDAVSGNNCLRFQMEDASVPIANEGKLLNIEVCERESNNNEKGQCSGSDTGLSDNSIKEICDVNADPEQEKADKIYESANEAIEAYRKILEVKYSVFFDSASKTVSKFSAFENSCKGRNNNGDDSDDATAVQNYECRAKCTFQDMQKNEDANGTSSDDEIYHSL
ncbi:unnamed protein product [Orchesella dallaii]|uniref:Uncharacterized protein n=1 Tax=Orchesella dallaii TaxID=48710 RepID=A0ABP1PWY0_9HEXA